MSHLDSKNEDRPSYDVHDSLNRSEWLKNVRRVVVKVGTHVLSREDNSLDESFVDYLIGQVAAIRATGLQVAIVTSGAVGAGMGSMGISRRPTQIEMLQGLASIGQTVLMHRYKTAARDRGMRVGQVLLTAGDLNRKRDYIHVQGALRALFQLDAIPVINENDSVAVQELRFGDNDSLSAHIANLINADLLVIFTDIEGLFAGSPNDEPKPPLVRTVWNIDRSIEQLCTSGGRGIGGMRTKVEAAKTLAASGVPTVIAHGREVTLDRILAGEPVGTFFVPQANHTRAHRRWILARKIAGTLVIDTGAAKALVERNMSLLPSGIRNVSGRFSPGDAVSIIDEDGREVARGLVRYSSTHAKVLAGHHSRDIQSLLGFHAGDDIVHRDNLIIVVNGTA